MPAKAASKGALTFRAFRWQASSYSRFGTSVSDWASGYERRNLDKVVVLGRRDEVQRHMRLLDGGDNFKASYNMQLSLAQSGRLLFLCLSQTRVVRCDFVES